MRLRLILSFVLVALVSVTSVALIARQGAASEVRSFMFRGGMSGATDVVQVLEDYYHDNSSWQGVETLFSSSMHGQGGSGMGHGGQGKGMMMGQDLRLADADGNWVVDSSAAPLSGGLSSAEKEVAIPLEVHGRTVGFLLVEGGMSFTQSDEAFLVNRLSQAALFAGLIAGGLALLLALLLAYSLMRPVRELTRAASRLGRGDLSQRVRVSGDDELAVLGKTFNQMAGSLQQAQESRRLMTADIAHELRNPLAVQRANLEALQDGVYPPTPENLEPVLEQNRLLTRLVDDLRTLALADSGQLGMERTPTDFPSLVVRVVERFRAQAANRQLELQIGQETRAAGEILVDPMRVEQILTNLLSNALRYTPEGGRIEIEVRRNTGGVQLSIHDSGPGIPVDALPHVFERFYRADPSRSRAEGGSGLGLAIARHLAEAHSGTLVAANHPQGGAVFTLSLPAT